MVRHRSIGRCLAELAFTVFALLVVLSPLGDRLDPSDDLDDDAWPR